MQEGWRGWDIPFWLMLNQIRCSMKLPLHCSHCDHSFCLILFLFCSSPSQELLPQHIIDFVGKKKWHVYKNHVLSLILQESRLVKCNSQFDEEMVSKIWKPVLLKGGELLWGDKSVPSLEVINGQRCDMMAFEINTVCLRREGRWFQSPCLLY